MNPKYQEAYDKTIAAYKRLEANPGSLEDWDDWGDYSTCRFCKVSGVVGHGTAREGACGDCPLSVNGEPISCTDHATWQDFADVVSEFPEDDKIVFAARARRLAIVEICNEG